MTSKCAAWIGIWASRTGAHAGGRTGEGREPAGPVHQARAVMAKIRPKPAKKREQGAADLGFTNVLFTEDVEFAADLCAIWPTLPTDWRHVETYLATAFLGDPDVQQYQVWLCGMTGELCIQLTMATEEEPLLTIAFMADQGIQPVRLYPEGTAGPPKSDLDAAYNAIHALHFRYRVPMPGVH